MEIKVLKNILSANDELAERNRQLLKSHKVFAINLMSSPGAGKTSLLLSTIRKLKGKIKIGVIEGDISSSVDAETIGKEKVPVIQINTGGECHLDANMINRGLNSLPLQDIELLIVENVGNLVCPAEFSIGEDRKVMLASVPEGDDKPYKYPLMFQKADVILVNKIDLLPYVSFNMEAFSKAVKAINAKGKIIQISCTTDEGLDQWIKWIRSQVGGK